MIIRLNFLCAIRAFLYNYRKTKAYSFAESEFFAIYGAALKKISAIDFLFENDKRQLPEGLISSPELISHL